MFQFNFDVTEGSTAHDDQAKETTIPDATSEYDECIEITPAQQQLNLEQIAHDASRKTTVFKNNHQIVHIGVDKAFTDRLAEEADDLKSAERNDSDVVPGIYEGGAKIWECTQDLGDYLTALDDTGRAIIDEFIDKSVLDLGCGAGLLGILALQHGSSTVHFQDYNGIVLQKITMPNVILSMENDETMRQCINEKCKFYSGDWNNYVQKTKDGEQFDRIVTSETIYNTKNYAKIINVLKHKLKSTGICYLAAKSHYFGVGGSLRQFELALRDDGAFRSEIVFVCHENVSREILRIAHNWDGK